MLILALDAATRDGSCALARGETVLAEAASDPSRPQAARLPGDLMALLEGVGVDLHEVDLFAVASGPGSFTGLRVGIATLQGLAFAGARPLVGVSAFDALAEVASSAGPMPGPVQTATWIDAWRGEVYAALYADGAPIAPPSVERPDALLARLRGRPTLFTGDGARTYAAAIRDALADDAFFTAPPAPVLAGAIARLAARTPLTSADTAPGAIRPLYVRRPDAELARDARPRG